MRRAKTTRRFRLLGHFDRIEESSETMARKFLQQVSDITRKRGLAGSVRQPSTTRMCSLIKSISSPSNLTVDACEGRSDKPVSPIGAGLLPVWSGEGFLGKRGTKGVSKYGERGLREVS